MDPFVAEIRIFPFNFAPKGWAFCDGQILSISQNTALFSLLGTTYGGDGRVTFALPNLQGSAPVNSGQGPGLTQRDLGEIAGETDVTVLVSQMPQHSHHVNCATSAANNPNPVGNIWATAGTRGAAVNLYSATPGSSPVMNPVASGLFGSGQPHNNLPPYLTLNFCIALQGVFPPRG
jgi:microcystin-dependent protein